MMHRQQNIKKELMFMCKLYMRVDHVEWPQLSMSLFSNNPAWLAALWDSNSGLQTCHSRAKHIAIPIPHIEGAGLYWNIRNCDNGFVLYF